LGIALVGASNERNDSLSGVFVIHNDYLKMLPKEDIRNGFSELFDVLSTTWYYCTLGDYEDEYLRKARRITEDIVRKGNILIENIKM